MLRIFFEDISNNSDMCYTSINYRYFFQDIVIDFYTPIIQ